ncbi:MAG: LacI family DNA-binding transcriptional regulator [Succinivibrio sp.]
MSVTLKTIAEYTGLSVTTVSRALKNGDDVKQKTIDKVKAAAKELGYAPNIQGLSLKTGINYNLVAVLPVIKSGEIIGDVGTLALISGLTAGIAGTPYTLSVVPMLPDQDPLEPIKYAVESRLAGGIIINCTKTRDERVTYLEEHKVPYITFGQTEMSINHAFADIDNYDMGYRAASYLYQKGCKKITAITSSQDYTYACHKYYGVKRASMEYGLEFDKEKNVVYDYQVQSQSNYRKYFAELMSKPDHPDGIFCGSEISCLGTIAGIQDAGLIVNKDVHVIQVETCELPVFFQPQTPGLRQNFHSIGRILSKYLVKIIEGEDPKKLQYIEKATFFPR